MRAFFSFSSVSVAAPTFDLRHAAGQLRQTLFQLLAIDSPTSCSQFSLRICVIRD